MAWADEASRMGVRPSPTRLGVVGYGFAPLRLPADLDFTGLFHGVDERVPVDALHFGCQVLDQLVRQY